MSGDHKLDDTPETASLDPAMFAASARGSLEAHRLNRDDALALAHSGVAPFDQVFAVAEVFARMASSFGHPADRKTLAGMLFKRAQLFSTDDESFGNQFAQAMAQLDAAADAGDVEATTILTLVGEAGTPPALFKLAQALRDLGSTV